MTSRLRVNPTQFGRVILAYAGILLSVVIVGVALSNG